MLKLIATCLFFLSFFKANAQEVNHLTPPVTNWKKFGFEKQVLQSIVAYYKRDSLGYEPAMLEVYNFDDAGQLTQKFIRIYGKYSSETLYNYVYNNGKLDSLNTRASASSFNSQQKMYYNEKGQLVKIVATGKYVDYEDTFTYDQKGLVSVIERKYKSGITKTTRFDRKKNMVVEKETSKSGKVTEQFFVYDGDALFAWFEKGESSVVHFQDTYRRTNFEAKISGDALDYIVKLLELKQSNHPSFLDKLSDLQTQKTSTINYEVPALSSNETGDWIKRYQIDKRSGFEQKRLVFRKLMYADGSKSGSTEYDLIFEQKAIRTY